MEQGITYYAREPFRHGKAVVCITKNLEGRITGEYNGYWNEERGTVTLYPAKGSWIYGRLIKHTVSERLVRRAY
jgi:hypothetical protein